MSNEISFQSPLVEFVAGANAPTLSCDGVEVRENRFNCYFNLRLQSDLRGSFSSKFQCALPVEPNTVAERGDMTCLWLRDDEWLLIAPNGRHRQIAEGLESLCSGKFAAWTDQTSGFTSLSIEGGKSVDLLSRGIVFDPDPNNLRPSHCVQTMLGKTRVAVINRTEGASIAYELIVRRSFSDYLWRWLSDKMSEAYFCAPASAIEK